MANGLVRHGQPAVVPNAAAADQAVNQGQLDTSIATRAPTVHTHAAADITSGQFISDRMPAVLSNIRTVINATGAIGTDASLLGNNRNITATGNITLNVPTNPTDGQVLQFTILASGATRTVAFAAGIGRLTGVLASYDVPSTKIMRLALRYSALDSSWTAESAAVKL